jgi:hypothetical protein
MIVRSHRRKKPITCRVRMAILAVEGSVHPLDLDVRDLDLAPTSLDLPATQEVTMRSHHHCVCAKCGRPLRKGYV